jgi:hypothetical protein
MLIYITIQYPRYRVPLQNQTLLLLLLLFPLAPMGWDQDRTDSFVEYVLEAFLPVLSGFVLLI